MTRLLLCASCLALTVFPVSLPAEPSLDVAREDVRQFVATMVDKHHFKRRQVNAVLKNAQLQPRILEAIQRPAEKTMAWWEYRQRFITEERIAGGVQLWQDHRAELDRIATRTGVPAEYLIAITGVETFYGRNTGRYRVLDALATLGFDYPPRAPFFRKELEEFLLMTREEKLDPRAPLGSYAGAMGVPQFMPSSFRNFAVDGNGDGRRNLWEHGADVFASIANYFLKNGWHRGEPVLANAFHESAPDDPAAAQLAMNDTVGSLHARGYLFTTSMPDQAATVLLPAALEQGMSWRVGFRNFYVITRYNRSPLYAMAVHDLALAIGARYRATNTAASAPTAAPAP